MAELLLYNARREQTFRNLLQERSGRGATGFVVQPRQQRFR
jgi:hypothetical protein